MAKARMIGYNKRYIPNRKADRRYRPATFFQGKERAETAADRECEKRETRRNQYRKTDI